MLACLQEMERLQAMKQEYIHENTEFGSGGAGEGSLAQMSLYQTLSRRNPPEGQRNVGVHQLHILSPVSSRVAAALVC